MIVYFYVFIYGCIFFMFLIVFLYSVGFHMIHVYYVLLSYVLKQIFQCKTVLGTQSYLYMCLHGNHDKFLAVSSYVKCGQV